jgi:GH18 family chitinase
MGASLLIASLLIAIAASACGPPQLAAQPKVVGYFYRGMPENIVQYSKLTHVIFSCARPTSTGDLTLTTAELDQLRRIRDLAHNAGIKVMIAIGEWGDDTRFFNATTPTYFNTFTNNIINLVNNENLDGVDIDWEYPENYNGDTGAPRSGEISQFTSLLSALRTQWSSGSKLITAAIPSDPNIANITGAWHTYLDWINIMDYDHEDTFPHSTMASARAAYSYWVTERGLSSAKFVLGVPFYGAARETNDPQRSFSVLVKFYGADPHANQVRIGGRDWGYNGIDLIKQKTAWIIDPAQAGGGIMIWQVGGWDLTGENSLLSAIDQVINGSPISEVLYHSSSVGVFLWKKGLLNLKEWLLE